MIVRPAWPDEVDLRGPPRPILPRGLGRSYGDSCLNDGGTLLDLTRLDRIVRFDPTEGILRADARNSLEQKSRFCISEARYPAFPAGPSGRGGNGNPVCEAESGPAFRDACPVL